MPTIEPIEVEGLREIARQLRRVSTDLPKALRIAGNEAADIVVRAARSDIPRRSGKAAASIKAKSTRTAVRISSGGRRAPYVPWLDYGGKVGRDNTASRPFIPDGRYVYPAFRSNKRKVEETYRAELKKIVEDAGLEVT